MDLTINTAVPLDRLAKQLGLKPSELTAYIIHQVTTKGKENHRDSK